MLTQAVLRMPPARTYMKVTTQTAKLPIQAGTPAPGLRSLRSVRRAAFHADQDVRQHEANDHGEEQQSERV